MNYTLKTVKEILGNLLVFAIYLGILAAIISGLVYLNNRV